MKYFLIAGEASGDLHGSNLMRALREQDSEAFFRYFGGDRMQAIAEGLVIHYREMAYMGYIEVLLHLRSISKNMHLCKKAISDFQPDVVILIDYPGFNLHMAEFVRSIGIPVFYYISPKIWAWKKYRIKKIRSFVNRMFIILPFEQEFYRKYGMEADYMGNPVVDEVEIRKADIIPRKQFLRENNLDDRPVIALLPGSRKQELHHNLPVMMTLINDYPGYHFLIAGAPAFTQKDYNPYIHDTRVKVVFNRIYDLLGAARAALVTSGTATLETALMNVPQIVLYKMNGLTYQLGKYFVKVDFISLVNLILGEKAVTELIQNEVCYDRVKRELDKILSDTPEREIMLNRYRQLRETLGGPGVSERVATQIISYLRKN